MSIYSTHVVFMRQSSDGIVKQLHYRNIFFSIITFRILGESNFGCVEGVN